MQGERVLYSSESGDWCTPRDLYDVLDREFDFTLDAAADNKNALCEKFFTEYDSAFENDWTGRIFCNPPYGRGVDKWVYRACTEIGNGHADLVVMLLAARVDRILFHDCVMSHATEVRFIRGRLHFSGHKDPAGFPSMVVVWRPSRVLNGPRVWSWNWKSEIQPRHP